MGRSGLERLEDVIFGLVELAGQLGHRGRTAETMHQLGFGSADFEVQLLDSTRRTRRPSPITEVALELALDGSSGVGREQDAPVGIEPVDRSQNCEEPHLLEVFAGHTAALVALGQERRDASVLLGQLVAQLPTAGSPAFDELLEERIDSSGGRQRCGHGHRSPASASNQKTRPLSTIETS